MYFLIFIKLSCFWKTQCFYIVTITSDVKSDRLLGAGVGREAMELVRERYPDFGPTFACEKLVEVHGHRVSVETVRKWMVAEGV